MYGIRHFFGPLLNFSCLETLCSVHLNVSTFLSLFLQNPLLFFFFFFFFLNSFFSSYQSPFLFSFFNPFFDLFFLNFIKIINLDKLLLKDRGYISYCFIALRVFPEGNFKLFFVLLRFKDNVEIVLHIKTTSFSTAIYFWGDIGINILKKVLVTR